MIGVIQRAWSRETSYWPDRWRQDLPSIGQCAVTALLVKDLMGGDIWRCYAQNGGETHFFNRVAGVDLDLTRDQFDSAETFRRDVPVNLHIYLDRDPDLRARYELLKARAAA